MHLFDAFFTFRFCSLNNSFLEFSGLHYCLFVKVLFLIQIAVHISLATAFIGYHTLSFSVKYFFNLFYFFDIKISHAAFGGSNRNEKRCPLRFSCVKFNRSKAVFFAALERFFTLTSMILLCKIPNLCEECLFFGILIRSTSRTTFFYFNNFHTY